MNLITKKRDERNLENFNAPSLNDNTGEQWLKKVEVLEQQKEELLDQVGKLEGIRGALEEKVSAYRYQLKDVTKQLEEVSVSSTKDNVVYHNKDNVERRRFVLQKQGLYRRINNNAPSAKPVKSNDLQERYDQLLEQYTSEREKNEQLSSCMLQNDKNSAQDLFTKVEAADTLLSAAALSRSIIQKAEEQAQHIERDLKEQVLSVLRCEKSLPQEVIRDLRNSIRCLEE